VSIISHKGQITVFIIIGLLLLFTVGAIFYIQYKFKPAFELSEDPVAAYVQQCLIDTTEQAVILAGQTGGNIFQEELTSEEKKLTKLVPFNSDILLIGNQQLSYWYYQKNDGIDRIAIPDLEKEMQDDNSIQSQIELYIEENLLVCLDDFNALPGMEITPKANLSVTSVIGETDIEVSAYYPLEIKQGDAVSTQAEFTASMPSGLKKSYALAKEIAENELNTLFLEQTTRNLLSTYGQVDKNYLPPMAGGLHFETCANRVFWFYPDVKEDVQYMLTANIPYISVENTENSRIIIDSKKEQDDKTRELRQSVFDSFILQSDADASHAGLTASFSYQPSYPIDLRFGNNVGYGLLQPDTFEINLLVANLCMFEYSFLYNLKYPVLVTITDTQNPIEGNAFVFQFPLQVIIKNNNARIRLNDILRKQYVIPETSDMPSYQCDPEQRLSGESTMIVTDADANPVQDAVVTFQCGPSYVYEYDVNGTLQTVHQFAETCFMGTTDELGKLTTAFPPCIGSGIATVKHTQYLEKSVATGDILQGESFEQQITLDKVYAKTLNIQKYFVAPPAETNEEGIGIHLDENGNIIACNINLEPKEFQPYESAIVTLTKLDVQNGILNTIPVIIYNGSDGAIDIAPGQYYVDIMLLREEKYPGEMTIPAHSEAITVPTTFGQNTTTYPDEDILVPSTFSGGSVFLWNVTAAELESGSTIQFAVFDEGPPKTIEQVSAALMHREACSALQSELVAVRIS
jgi:hypothetical protein